jgi:acid stress-induced BolA-like protein IbaG/YrbA
MRPEDIKQLIETGIPGARAIVDGEDGIHFQATVISPTFSGLSMVKRHQQVYQTLGERLRSEIHALALKTLTPEEWRSAREQELPAA